jgi:hypothetical protein
MNKRQQVGIMTRVHALNARTQMAGQASIQRPREVNGHNLGDLAKEVTNKARVALV